MPKVKLITIVVLAIVMGILVLQNTQPVETRFLLATVTMPRAVLLLVTATFGFVLGVLVSLVAARRKGED